MFTFLITSLLTITGFALNVTIDNELVTDPEPNYMTVMAAVTWRCGQMLAYSLFIARFRQCFRHTKYATSDAVYCLLYFGAILFILIYALYIAMKSLFKVDVFI